MLSAGENYFTVVVGVPCLSRGSYYKVWDVAGREEAQEINASNLTVTINLIKPKYKHGYGYITVLNSYIYAFKLATPEKKKTFVFAQL